MDGLFSLVIWLSVSFFVFSAYEAIRAMQRAADEDDNEKNDDDEEDDEEE